MKNIWKESEGDNWFLRNKVNLGENFDVLLFLLKLYYIKPANVLEIGAANGYRLAELYKKYNSYTVVIEPSKKAIEDGRKKYPFIKFIKSTIEDCKLGEKFNLIIVNFVFHWIYRENLYTCVAKIDGLLEKGGYLIIGDFGTESFLKKKYHYLKNIDFYTWKMEYWELFTRSGNYLELAKIRFNHDTHKICTDINIDNMATVVMLKKQDLYIER